MTRKEPNMLDEWLEQISELGPLAAVDQLRRLLDEAPEEAHSTQDYAYFSGVCDYREAVEKPYGWSWIESPLLEYLMSVEALMQETSREIHKLGGKKAVAIKQYSVAHEKYLSILKQKK